MPETGAKRIGFAGTPAFAELILRGLLDNGVVPVVVLTGADKPRGRGRKPSWTPVRAVAESESLPTLTAERLLDTKTVDELSRASLDIFVVAAYGLLLPPQVLNLPRLGCINVHPSLLPRWRGAAPIERAIMHGDSETGVCIMRMDEGLDTGPVYHRTRIAIGEDATADDLAKQLAQMGIAGLLRVINDLPNAVPSPQAQAGACYAEKITKADQQIDWTRDSRLVCRQIHGLNSTAPACASIHRQGEHLRVRFLRAKAHPASSRRAPGEILDSAPGDIQIACGTGSLALQEAAVLQGAGKRLDARALLNGFADVFRPGNRFSSRAALD